MNTLIRHELLAAIRQTERDIEAAEARMDREAAKSSRDPETQAETDRRVEDEYGQLWGLEARLGALEAQLRLLPAPPVRPSPPRGSLAERFGW